LFSCKSLRESRYSHAHRHVFKNPDSISSAVAHELFWPPLTASCARAARASGLRTGVLFFLLSFAAKTSYTVVVVVKDNLLSLLCRILTQILGRFAMFYESFIRSRWLHDRSSFLWKLGNIGFPKQFFLNTQNWLKLFQQVKPPLYANFVSNSTKVTLREKSRAPPYLFWSFGF